MFTVREGNERFAVAAEEELVDRQGRVFLGETAEDLS
jgi:hypothetical protein